MLGEEETENKKKSTQVSHTKHTTQHEEPKNGSKESRRGEEKISVEKRLARMVRRLQGVDRRR